MDQPASVVAARPARLKVGIGAAVVLVLLGLGVAILVTAVGPHGSTQTVTEPTTGATTAAGVPGPGVTATASGSTIYVHILGAVAKPGLYLLKDGDRAVDAISAAGGFGPTADQSTLNLARLLVDGEQISVPAIGEAQAPPPAGSEDAAVPGGKVNINSADETTLETLPRVGPAMAKRIIDWRTKNGRFTAVEDLMSVTGIGEKTFEQLKDLVSL